MTTAPPIPCPTCRYDLRGLVLADGATCPECGGTFTLQQLPPPPPQYRVSARTLLILLACTPLVVLFSYLGLATMDRFFTLSLPVNFGFMAVAVAFLWATGVELLLLRRAQPTNSWPHKLYPLFASPLLGAVIAGVSTLLAFAAMILIFRFK